jgi:hypothetical protein
MHTLPALPKLQQSSPLLVSHCESTEQDLEQVSVQMPFPGGGPVVSPPVPPLPSSEDFLLPQPPKPAAATNTNAPIARNLEEIEVRLIR